MLASSLSFGLSASVSTLAERDVLIKEAFEKGPADAVEAINKYQQEDKIKVDDQHYIVVIKKDGDKYIRVAHFKKEKINQAVEQSIMNVMQEAEAKLSGGSGPVAFDFSAAEKKLYAVLSKQGDFLVFNICPTEDELKGLLAAGTKSEEAKAPVVAATPAPEKVEGEKKEEPKKEEVKQEEVKPADATAAPAAAPVADAAADKPADTATAPVATPAPSADVSAPASEKTTDVVPENVALADAKPTVPATADSAESSTAAPAA